MSLADLNCNFNCDWLIELSDNRLSNNKLSNKKLSDDHLGSELVENRTFSNQSQLNRYLLLTEFEGRTVSYGRSFFLLDLWPKCEARGP